MQLWVNVIVTCAASFSLHHDAVTTWIMFALEFFFKDLLNCHFFKQMGFLGLS